MVDRKIGVIGTGIMGEPMARNLMSHGYEVHVYSRTKSKAKQLLIEGATWHDSPSALAEQVDVVISIVSDSPDVEAICECIRVACALAGAGRKQSNFQTNTKVCW